jgi:hypothetical protein
VSGSRDRERYVSELLTVWAEIEALAVELNSPAIYSSKVHRQLIARWFDIFSEEIELLERIRNAVVHGGSVEDTDLREAIEMARRLLRLLDAKRRPVKQRIG